MKEIYQQTAEEVLERVESRESGLTDEQVRRSREKCGWNLSEGKKTALLLTVPKNGKTRAVPLHPALLPLLETWLSQLQDGDFLLTGTRYPVEPRTCSNRFKKFLKDCGLRDTHFHTLRHTFATECVESGVNLKVLSEILGHSSIQITASRYIHLSMRYKKQQIGFLSFPGYSPSNKPSGNAKTA